MVQLWGDHIFPPPLKETEARTLELRASQSSRATKLRVDMMWVHFRILPH